MAVKAIDIQRLPASNGHSLRGISKGKALEMFSTMLRIRRVEEALIEEYHPADEMRCPIHFCVGQEAPPTGVCANLRPDDYLFTHHRSHGYYLAKGGRLREMFAELYGKATGINGGMTGHQEISDTEANIYSGPILVGHLPIAAGTAWSFQARGEDRVAVAVLGDGGADEGLVYETLNYAVLKRLPIIFICENNSYSVYSPQWTRQPLCNLAERVASFGMPAHRIDGNDVTTVSRAARTAIARARRGGGPTFIEMITYRWAGHVGPENDDHLDYRPLEEIAEWKKRDPVEATKQWMLGGSLLSLDRLALMEAGIATEIEDAFAFAKSSPFPDAGDLLRHNFAEYSQLSDDLQERVPRLSFDFHQGEARLRPY